MQVKEIMTQDLDVIRPDDTLQEAARKMKVLDMGPLPVSEGDKVVGMLTDRDITVRATAEGLDPKQTRVRQVMSKDVITILEDRRIVVVNPEKRPVGMLSLADLARHVKDPKLTGVTVEEVSAPSKH